MPGVAFPPVGPVGDGAPPSSVRCSAQTAPLPISGRFARRSLPATSPASVRSWCPLRAHARVEAPDHARACGRPVPSSGSMSKERDGSPTFPSSPSGGMPRSRPRWCPTHSPKRVWDCCLPVRANRRLSPPDCCEGYPAVHDYTHFGAPSRGLLPRALQLRTPIAGLARGVHY